MYPVRSLRETGSIRSDTAPAPSPSVEDAVGFCVVPSCGIREWQWGGGLVDPSVGALGSSADGKVAPGLAGAALRAARVRPEASATESVLLRSVFRLCVAEAGGAVGVFRVRVRRCGYARAVPLRGGGVRRVVRGRLPPVRRH